MKWPSCSRAAAAGRSPSNANGGQTVSKAGACAIFRTAYPKGENYIVCLDVDRSFARDLNGARITFLGLDAFVETLRGLA